MKVALLTMFNGLSGTYSLVNVVAEQVRMLLDADIETKVLVSESCPDHQRSGIFANERIEWVKVLNHYDGKIIHWRDYSQPDKKVHKSFFEEANAIAEDLKEKLKDADVVIMHDIHYQGWHLIHNVAVRKVQKELPHLRFIAFTHSAPVNRPSKVEWPLSARYTSMPKTTYVYPTMSGIEHLAKQYDVAEGRCRVVNNSIDILSFFHPDTATLAKKENLLSADYLLIYPARLTPAKKFDKVAAFAGALNRVSEKKVKVVFCDFPSMDIRPDTYKQRIRMAAKQASLPAENIVFTSDHEGFEHGFPRQAVLDLFTLSNIYICPSYSESFGLTVLEAASRGNYIIVNEAVPALQELGKNLKAHLMRWDARNFGFNTTENYHPSEKAYLEEHANKVMQALRGDSVIFSKTKTRQRYSPEWIWKNQLEPLLFH